MRTALALGAFGRGGKSPRRDLLVFDVEQRTQQDDLAGEVAAEEVFVALLDAGPQIGDRIGRDGFGCRGQN